MASTQEIYAHVLPAVRLIMEDLNGGAAAAGNTIEERVHAQLWSYVTHAVREVNPDALNTPAPKRDARAKAWKIVIRFWHTTPIGNDLEAQTDEEIIQGTGALQQIIPAYATEMHGHEGSPDFCPPELSEESIKEKLPQLRNNLGRQGSAVLRINYNVGDEPWILQCDVVAG